MNFSVHMYLSALTCTHCYAANEKNNIAVLNVSFVFGTIILYICIPFLPRMHKHTHTHTHMKHAVTVCKLMLVNEFVDLKKRLRLWLVPHT